jgi:hypothetical protein
MSIKERVENSENAKKAAEEQKRTAELEQAKSKREFNIQRTKEIEASGVLQDICVAQFKEVADVLFLYDRVIDIFPLTYTDPLLGSEQIPCGWQVQLTWGIEISEGIRQQHILGGPEQEIVDSYWLYIADVNFKAIAIKVHADGKVEHVAGSAPQNATIITDDYTKTEAWTQKLEDKLVDDIEKQYYRSDKVQYQRAISRNNASTPEKAKPRDFYAKEHLMRNHLYFV